MLGLRQITPKRDDASVGIGFVDVLFALVIGQALLSVTWRDVHRISGTKAADLLVAVVVTLTSWIGYHNSLNRPKFKIRFINWPLTQFILDILMVFVYWLLVTSSGLARSIHHPDGVTAGLVLAAFVLYCLWDFVSNRIVRQAKYQDLLDDRGEYSGVDWFRFVTTWGCTLACLIIWRIAVQFNTTITSTLIIDGALVVTAVVFRLLKDSKIDNVHRQF